VLEAPAPMKAGGSMDLSMMKAFSQLAASGLSGSELRDRYLQHAVGQDGWDVT